MLRFDLVVENFADLCHSTEELTKSVAKMWVDSCSLTHGEIGNKNSNARKSCEYSQPVSGTAMVQNISRNRAPAAHAIFPKNKHKPGFDGLCERILSDYPPTAADSTTKRFITSWAFPWIAPITTPCHSIF